MGVDQAHEKKNSKVVTVDGGAIGILEDEAALLKWTVGGSIVSDLLNQADQDISNPQKPPCTMKVLTCMRRILGRI